MKTPARRSAKTTPQIGVVFDLDGVIADTNPFHREAMRRFYDRHRQQMLPIDEATLRSRVFGFPNRAWIPSMFTAQLKEERVKELADEREEIFRSIVAGSLQPAAGLRELLVRLRNARIPCALASSAPKENIQTVLAETGLDDAFRIILHEGSVAAGKPSPDIYRMATTAIDIEPERCIVFEDSIAGLQAARSANCRVIGVSTTHNPKEIRPLCDMVISNFVGITLALLEGFVAETLGTTAATSDMTSDGILLSSR